MNELDVANAMRAFAHFKYINYEAMESLIKVSIKHAQEYKLQSLAVITNSLAQLDIQNGTYFSIIKNILLKDYHEDKLDDLIEKL
jgi:ribosomal protein L25 (general stress protein Ctc)